MDTFSNNPRSREIKADLEAELASLEQQNQSGANHAQGYALIRLWPKMLVTLLALAGLFVSGYLALHELTGSPLICTVTGSCEEVNNSPYGFWFGIPVSVFGVGGYLAIGIAALAGLRLTDHALLRATNLQLACATLGLLASGYFTSIEAFVLNKWCQWCVASAIIMTIIFILSIIDRRSVQPVSYSDEGDDSANYTSALLLTTD
jgi:uncharacterized membrane protein